jgi:hypothetical protein
MFINTKQGCFLLLLILILLPNSVLAGNVYCDDFGNCFGGGINTYRDSFGNTSGRIGDQRVNCYTDSFGNTSCR